MLLSVFRSGRAGANVLFTNEDSGGPGSWGVPLKQEASEKLSDATRKGRHEVDFGPAQPNRFLRKTIRKSETPFGC